MLDVGAGGNPYPRANVLLDGYEDTVERYHSALVCDRPFVFGMIEICLLRIRLLTLSLLHIFSNMSVIRRK